MPKDDLEKNLSELLDLSRKLREANKDLRNKNSKLNIENKNLKEKLELTKNKIENLINNLNDLELKIKKNQNNSLLIITDFILEKSSSEINN